YSRISAQLALAMIREDRVYFRQAFDDALEYLTIGQIIESQAIELTAVVLHTHGTVDAADHALVDTLQKVATVDVQQPHHGWETDYRQGDTGRGKRGAVPANTPGEKPVTLPPPPTQPMTCSVD